MPATIQVQVSFPRPSGLPQDNIVNTWHFLGTIGTSMADEMANIGPRLDEFYTVVDNYMPLAIGAPTYRGYDLGELKPRQPSQRASFGVDPAGAGATYPNEVALCLSYYATRNLPRQRGRLYLGPFIAAAGEITTQGDAMPTQFFVDLVANAALALKNAAGPLWAVRSVRDGVLRAITNLWIDNAWDTQRRRGTAATVRTRKP